MNEIFNFKGGFMNELERTVLNKIFRSRKMRPRRYPYSGKSKTSTIEIVKAWKNIYSDFIVKSQKEQEKSEQELDKAIHELYQ